MRKDARDTAERKREQEHLQTDLGRERLAKSGTQLQYVVRLVSRSDW